MKNALSFLLLLTTSLASAQTDFTGKWKLNLDKTQFNGTPGTPTSSAVLTDVQEKDVITLQREESPKETLTIDNKDEVEMGTAGIEGSKNKVSIKTTPDRKGLIETRTYTYPETETAVVANKKTRTWALSPDKKVLTIDLQIEASNGENYSMRLVYDRQL